MSREKKKRSFVVRKSFVGLGSAALIGGILVACAQPNMTAPIAMEPIAFKGEKWARYGDWPKPNWDKFNTLRVMAAPPAPKIGQFKKNAGDVTGDPAKGQQLAFDRSRGGSCVACHILGPKTPEGPGNVGPDLSDIGSQGRDDLHLFNYVWDARAFNPESVMPPWGAHGVFNEEEVGHIVAFLKTLTRPYRISNKLDDPNSRPVPIEDRDYLDPFVNVAMLAVDDAQEMVKKAGPMGKSCVSCHAKPEVEFKTWAASMPRWDARINKVIGVEEFVFRHAAATTGEKWPMQSKENTALAIYLRYLANGTPIKLDTTSPGAAEAYKRGEAMTKVKLGQLNFACIDCHTPEKGANKWIRGQWLGEQRGQVPHFPVFRTSRNEIWDIRKRFQWCNVAIRANELPPDAPEYGDLELYVVSKSEGLTLKVPGIRH